MPLSTIELEHTLSINPWFAGLSEAVRRAMVVRSTPLALQAGEPLFRQGERPRAWYGVLRGAVLLSTLREDGKEHIMAVMEAGSWVGESALVGLQPCLNNAVAQGPTQVLALPAEAFADLMRDADFARPVAELITGRYRLLYEALGHTALLSTRARIAQRLIHLSRGDAALAPQSRRRIRVSQDALAMMLGITRQTLSLELKRMVQQGVLRLGYRCIEVLSDPGLQRISRG